MPLFGSHVPHPIYASAVLLVVCFINTPSLAFTFHTPTQNGRIISITWDHDSYDPQCMVLAIKCPTGPDALDIGVARVGAGRYQALIPPPILGQTTVKVKNTLGIGSLEQCFIQAISLGTILASSPIIQALKTHPLGILTQSAASQINGGKSFADLTKPPTDVTLKNCLLGTASTISYLDDPPLRGHHTGITSSPPTTPVPTSSGEDNGSLSAPQRGTPHSTVTNSYALNSSTPANASGNSTRMAEHSTPRGVIVGAVLGSLIFLSLLVLLFTHRRRLSFKFGLTPSRDNTPAFWIVHPKQGWEVQIFDTTKSDDVVESGGSPKNLASPSSPELEAGGVALKRHLELVKEIDLALGAQQGVDRYPNP